MDLNYIEILSKYSQEVKFSRYDILTYRLIQLGLSDVTTDKHLLSPIYRSYNTYRKDVANAPFSLKVNETYNDEDNITQNYYDTSLLLDKIEDNYTPLYRFGGVVLSPKYPTNLHEMTLEDLFAEFYYDYLLAQDIDYMLSNNQETLYFNKADFDPITNEETPAGLYRILPIGETFIDEDNDNAETIIEYDGTTVPKIGELLSGKLYIVIKSPGMKPKKIMFNNEQLPTLFINDDKYIGTDIYIMNDNQLLRLCDIKLFERLGFSVAWKRLLSIKNINKLITNINNNISTEIPAEQKEAVKLTKDNVIFNLYYYGTYYNSGTNDNVRFLSGMTTFKSDNRNIDIKLGNSLFYLPGELTNDEISITTENKMFINLDDGYKIPTIKPIPGLTEHYIILTLYFGLTLVLKGYKLWTETAPPPQPPQTETTYQFIWYEYQE